MPVKRDPRALTAGTSVLGAGDGAVEADFRERLELHSRLWLLPRKERALFSDCTAGDPDPLTEPRADLRRERKPMHLSAVPGLPGSNIEHVTADAVGADDVRLEVGNARGAKCGRSRPEKRAE